MPVQLAHELIRPLPKKHFKGLSREMDLAFDDHIWLVLGLDRGRGHFLNEEISRTLLTNKKQGRLD
jgi:hypothetical protein